MPDICYLNGEFLPIEDAYVHIEDRGFQFGDSLYEVVRMYDGVPFRASQHLDRLFRGLEFIQLEIPYQKEDLLEIFDEAAKRSGHSTAFIYLQVTRGSAGPRSHVFVPGYKPTVVITVRPVEPIPEPVREAGLKAITHPDWRWANNHVKATTLLPNILIRTKVSRLGCYDAVLYREDGYITEGTVSNFFAILNGVLRTHPLTGRILAGITRMSVLEIAKAQGIPFEERAIQTDEVYHASEAFFADTYGEVIPIVDIDGHAIGTGKAGPLAMQIWRAFREMVKKETAR
ncbi:MAG: aminotransferase class IV [Bacillota bacterium]|nr:aminotransferase class IV [Bacillota bacterium]